jgi:protein tyrosine/serine phosphatase
MPRFFPYLFGPLVIGLLIAGPIAHALHHRAGTRNFRVVREGVLYRSGQMRLTALKGVLKDYGIRTVVTLRDAAVPGDRPPDWAEEEYCKAEEINYVRIPPRTWWSADGSVPAEEGVCRFRQVMDDPDNYPVLIHCFAGLHRSGAFCAIYRMEYERWPLAEALAEMKALGYSNLDDEWDILGYLEQYRPRGRE